VLNKVKGRGRRQDTEALWSAACCPAEKCLRYRTTQSSAVFQCSCWVGRAGGSGCLWCPLLHCPWPGSTKSRSSS